MNDKLFLAQIMKKAIEILIKYANLEENDALEIAEFFEEWKPNMNYGSNQWLKYGVNEQGRAQLYTTTRNVVSQANATPDITTNSYKKIVAK